VFLFDIDHFKAYNDGNGHVAGDRLLQELAGLVERRIRRDDIFGRFGGEEFLLVMPDTAREQALAAANKLREAIARQEFPFFDTQPLGHLSISGGVASYPSNGSDAEALIRAADAALYEAKGSGRNRVLAAMGEYRSEPGPPPVGREPSPG
jgi:diguanylate cyclase (GGDEF)-like protein